MSQRGRWARPFPRTGRVLQASGESLAELKNPAHGLTPPGDGRLILILRVVLNFLPCPPSDWRSDLRQGNIHHSTNWRSPMRLLLSRTFLYITLIAGLACVPVSAQTLSDLHNFTGQPDGGYPGGNVVADKNGNLYGTSEGGGSGCTPIGCGTVWELSPPATAGGAWTETILYNFQGTSSDGSSPWGGLTMDAKGNLWGTTQFGGGSRCSGGCGTVFQLKRPTSGGNWTHHLAHSFAGGTHDGQQPLGGVVFDSAGNLYGTALGGGSHTSCAGGSWDRVQDDSFRRE